MQPAPQRADRVVFARSGEGRDAFRRRDGGQVDARHWLAVAGEGVGPLFAGARSTDFPKAAGTPSSGILTCEARREEKMRSIVFLLELCPCVCFRQGIAQLAADQTKRFRAASAPGTTTWISSTTSRCPCSCCLAFERRRLRPRGSSEAQPSGDRRGLAIGGSNERRRRGARQLNECVLWPVRRSRTALGLLLSPVQEPAFTRKGKRVDFGEEEGRREEISLCARATTAEWFVSAPPFEGTPLLRRMSFDGSAFAWLAWHGKMETVQLVKLSAKPKDDRKGTQTAVF